MGSSFFQSSAIVYMEKNLKFNVTSFTFHIHIFRVYFYVTFYLFLLFLIQDMPFLSSWAWINVFELLFTIPLVVAIPPVQGISFREIPHNVLYGYAKYIIFYKNIL